jgi:hypothetical protein
MLVQFAEHSSLLFAGNFRYGNKFTVNFNLVPDFVALSQRNLTEILDFLRHIDACLLVTNREPLNRCS